jgi:hypothetical protein
VNNLPSLPTAKAIATDIATATKETIHDSIRSDRAGAKVEIQRLPKHTGGFTGYSGKPTFVSAIGVPFDSSAISRTVRIHELLHANHTKQCRIQAHPIAKNAVEDCLVHGVYWDCDKLPNQANRDCLATGYKDLRSLPPIEKLTTVEDWNVAMLTMARSLSIILKIKKHLPTVLRERIRNRYPETIRTVIQEVVSLSRDDKRTKAIREMMKVIRDEVQEAKQQTEDNIQFANPGKGSTGDKGKSEMMIIDLPKTVPCNSSVNKITFARSGGRINSAKLAKAIANLSTHNLFKRQRKVQGGCIVLDASGSMGVSTSRLTTVCSAVSESTVAYYGSNGRDNKHFGALKIFAKNGNRASEAQFAGGTNSVDRAALAWLLQQPGPRVWVSDGAFCGGRTGQDIAATAMLSQAIAQGKLVSLSSIAQLEKHLGLPEYQED